MAHWESRWVYRNLVDSLADASADITLVNNSAESTLPVENLAAFQPSEVMRTTAAPHAGLYIHVLLDSVNSKSFEVDTAWLGFTNLTPHLNLLANGDDFDSWTKTNVDPTVASAPPVLLAEFVGAEIEATGAGSVKHNVAQTWTTWAATANNATITSLVASVYLLEATADPVDEIRLAIVNVGSSDESYVDIDLSDGSVSAATDSGTDFTGGKAVATSFTPVSTSGDAHSGVATGYRLSFPVTVNSGGDLNNIRVEIRMLMGGSETFVQSSEVFFAAAAQLEIGTAATPPADNTTDLGALTHIGFTRNSAPDSARSFVHLPRMLDDWKNDLGWVHAPARADATVSSPQYVVFRIRDTGNADGYFEAGRMVIGKSFKPTAPMVGLSRTWESGRHVWEVEYDYASAAEAERDFLDMYRHTAKRSTGEIESAGGQRYSPENKPVLFIADDAADDSEPERVIYGTLQGSQPIISRSQTKFRVTIRVAELPK